MSLQWRTTTALRDNKGHSLRVGLTSQRSQVPKIALHSLVIFVVFLILVSQCFRTSFGRNDVTKGSQAT